MQRSSLRASLRALFALLFAAGCHKAAPFDPNAPLPAGTRLLLAPEGALLNGAGASVELTATAVDADGKSVDVRLLDLEWISATPDEVSAAATTPGKARATAAAALGTSAIVARSKRDPTIFSNASLVTVASVNAGVQLVSDAQVIFPPPRAPELLVDKNGRLPGISAPDAAGHVTIGGFADTDVFALFGGASDADGNPTSVLQAVVLQGKAPAVGTLLYAADGAPVMGRVVAAREQGGYALVQLELAAVDDIFADAKLHYDSQALSDAGLLDLQAHSRPRNQLVKPKPASEEGGKIDCEGGLGTPLNWGFPRTLSFNPRLTGAFEYESHGGNTHFLLKGGVVLDASAEVHVQVTAAVKLDYDCSIGEGIDFGPFPAPGPLAAVFAWGLNLKAYAKFKLTLTLGATFEIVPKASVHIPLVFGTQYDTGVGWQFINDGSPSGSASITSDFTPVDDTANIRVEVSGSVGARGTFIAILGGATVTTIRRLVSWIPWVGSQVEQLRAYTDVEVIRADLGPYAEGKWFWVGPAVSEQLDTAAIEMGLVLALKPLPKIGAALKKVFGGGLVAAAFKEREFKLPLLERTSLKQKNKEGETTKLSARPAGGDFIDAGAPILVEEGKAVTFKAELAKVEDAATEVRIYKLKQDVTVPGTPIGVQSLELLVTLPGGAAPEGDWTVPDGFCKSLGSKTQKLVVVGKNALFGAVPVVAYLGAMELTCVPLIFDVDGTSIDKDAPYTVPTPDKMCPGPTLRVRSAGGLAGTFQLTAHLDLGGASEDFGPAVTVGGAPLQKTIGLKEGSYTWTAKVKLTPKDGSSPEESEETRTLVVPACEVIRCGFSGVFADKGSSLLLNPTHCPATDVTPACKSAYLPAMGGTSLSGSVSGGKIQLAQSSAAPLTISGTGDLDAGEYDLSGSGTSSRAFGGGAGESFDSKVHLSVKCKPCPSDVIKDVCQCPRPPPACFQSTGNNPKVARGFGNPPPVTSVLGGGGGFGAAGGCIDCTSGPYPGGPPRRAANAWGDPHVVTHGGNGWTALELGEFVYARSPVQGGVELQVRQQKLPGFAQFASFNTAAAVRAGGHTFEARLPRDPSNPSQIAVDAHHPLELLIDGQLAELQPQVYVLSNELSFRVAQDNGVEVYFVDPTLQQTPADPRLAVTRVRLGIAGEQNLLRHGADPSEPTLAVDATMETNGVYRGVFGDSTSNGSADFVTPDGVANAGPDLDFMNTWRVASRDESLFTYLPGEGPETFALTNTSSIPSGDALAPFVAQAQSLLRDTCGLGDAGVLAADAVFVEGIAIELAAGRTEHNLVASGLCTDSRVQPPQAALVAFDLGGTVTLAGRPDVPVPGARVRVIASELSRVLCDATTIQDGRWGCSLTDYPNDYAPLAEITLDVRLSGRGADQTALQTFDAPQPGGLPVVLRQDFSVTLDHVLALQGQVLDALGLPAPGARVRVQSPTLVEALADASGAFTAVVPLPDGTLQGQLSLQAISADATQSASSTAPFAVTAPGVTPLSITVQLQGAPGGLPPIQAARRALIAGKAQNLFALQSSLPPALAGLRLSITSAAFINHACDEVATAFDGSYSCIGVLADDQPFAVNVHHAFGPDVSIAVAAADVPGPGELKQFTQDLLVAPPTLLVSGLVDTPQGPLAAAAVALSAQTGEHATTTADASGHYQALLVFLNPAGASGRITAAFSLAGAPDGQAALTAQADFAAPAGQLSTLALDGHLTTGTAVLAGAVVDGLASDAPVPGALVVVSGDGRELCRSATDDAGRFSCSVSSAGGGVLALRYDVGGRGAGSFTTFDGAPATLDLSQVPVGSVVPILPTRLLRVSPTTVVVSGAVTDAQGVAVIGAQVAARTDGAPAALGRTGDDGRYRLVLPLDEGRTAGVLQVGALLTQDSLAGKASAQVDFAGAAHALIAVPLDLQLDGQVQGGKPAATLAFSGLVSNGNVPGEPVADAVVSVFLAGRAGALCSAATDAAGRYACSATLSDAPASPAVFEWQLRFGGQPIADPVDASRTFQRTVAVISELPQNVVGQPTTLLVTGTVTDGAGDAVPGARVSFAGTAVGSAVADAQGEYRLVALAAPGVARATGTLVAEAGGVHARAALDVALAAGGLAQATQDLSLVERRLGFTGTVENSAAPGTFLLDGEVALSSGGAEFCRAPLRSTGSGTPPAFSCPLDLIVSGGGPVDVAYTVANAWGSRHATITVPAAQMPAGGQRALITLPLSLAATAVRVQGHVRGQGDAPISGAAVSLAVGAAASAATSSSDGSYAATLTLPDGLEAFGQDQLAHVVASARAGSDQAQAVLDAAVVPATLTQASLDLRFTAQTNLSFSGQVLNAAASAPLAGADVRIYRDGVQGSAGLLCEATAFGGRYACSRQLRGEALTQLAIRWEVWVAGTRLADPRVETVALTPGAAGDNPIARDLTASPTTVRVSGRLLDPQGAAIAGAGVDLADGSLAAVVSGSDGSYRFDVPLPEGQASFAASVRAQKNGNLASAPASLGQLTAHALNALGVDVTMSERRLTLAGRVENRENPGAPFAGERVQVTLAGQAVCDTTSSGAAQGNNFACAGTLVRTDGSAFTLHVEVSGPLGALSQDVAVTAAEVPGAGGLAQKLLFVDLDATTVRVAGIITRDGTPLANAQVALAQTGVAAGPTGAAVSGSDGSYDVRITLGALGGAFTARLSATDGTNSARADLSGNAAAGAETDLTRNLDISTIPPGSARWVRPIAYSFSGAPTFSAPAVALDGSVLAPAPTGVQALDAATGMPLWTGAFTGAGAFTTQAIRSGPVRGPDGAVYGGDSYGFVHGFSSAGVPLFHQRQPNTNGEIAALAIGGGVLYAAQAVSFAFPQSIPPQLLALDPGDGQLLWQAALAGEPTGIALAPDGTVLAATTSGLSALNPSGRLRWTNAGNFAPPALAADGTIVAAVDGALVALDGDGNELWRVTPSQAPLSLGGALTPPALDADGSIVLGVGGSLLRVAAAGQVLASAAIVASPQESLGRSAPAIASDGTIFVGSSGGQPALYARDAAFAALFEHRPASGVNTFLAPALLPDGAIAIGSTGDVRVLRPAAAAALAGAAWPKLFGDAANSGAAPASGPHKREVIFSGKVLDANAGASAPLGLPGFAVAIGPAGAPPLCRATSDAQGSYACALWIADAGQLSLDAAVAGRGYSADQAATAPAGEPGSSATVALDLPVAVTTARIAGTVTSSGQPVADASIAVASSLGAPLASPVASAADGTYAAIVLYDPETSGPDALTLRAEKFSVGVQTVRLTVQVAAGALADAAQDFVLQSRTLLWSRSTFFGDQAVPVANAATGAVYLTGRVCGEGGCQPQLAGFSADGLTRFDPHTAAGDFVGLTGFGAPPPAALASDGAVLVGGGQLASFDGDLTLRAMAALSGDTASRPLALPTAGQLLVPLGSGVLAAYSTDAAQGQLNQVWTSALPGSPQPFTQAALGMIALASGGLPAFVAIDDQVAGFDTGDGVANRALFSTPLGLGSSGDSSYTAVWNDGTKDLVQALVPGAGLSLLTTAGVNFANWPTATPLPASPGGLALTSDGISCFVTAPDGDGRTFLVALNPDASLRWSFEAPGETLQGAPALGPDGTLYVTSDRTLYAVAPPAQGSTASAAWSFGAQPNETFTARPSVGATAVFVAASSGTLYAVQR